MRRFIRHPSNIPIEISSCSSTDAPPSYRKSQVMDVSLGGLAFDSERPLELGTLVALRIPLVRPPFETLARVVWCRARTMGYKIGAEFLHTDDEFRARMVEQVCYIESYKRQVSERESRRLSSEEAAMEWISKYAAQFPEAGAEELH